SDSLMEEIDLFLASDESMPLGIEDDDFVLEGDICFLEELINNDSPLLPENEDKVFNPGILISLLSYRGEIISNFSKSPMMIYGGDIPYLDVMFLHFYPH
ncbi:hypothetical protein Tco_0225745, partial [Tanacetum coccineum]